MGDNDATEASTGPGAIIRRGDPAGRELQLAAVTTIGRASGNTVPLELAGVSRHHARILWDGASYMIEDLNSTNGTWLNGKRIDDAKLLADGDVIRVSTAEFVFQNAEAMTATITEPVRAGQETVTIMFTDLEGHTQMFERLGSERAYEAVSTHLGAMRQQVLEHGGRLIKMEGDGVIASFSSVRQAIDCAMAIQASHASVTQSGVIGRVRIGINTGDAFKHEDDLMGLAVIKAARIMALAAGGQTLISDVSRALLGPQADVVVETKGHYELKGIEGHERIYEVRPRPR